MSQRILFRSSRQARFLTLHSARSTTTAFPNNHPANTALLTASSSSRISSLPAHQLTSRPRIFYAQFSHHSTLHANPTTARHAPLPTTFATAFRNSTNTIRMSSTSATSDKIQVFDTIAGFRAWRADQVKQGKTIGFVPTMGALHDGHLGLVKEAKKENDLVVVSIFVNPAQFAPHEDLDQYPRTFDSDFASLQSTGVCSAILLPKVSEMYPAGITLDRTQQKGTFVEVVGLSHQMEGIPRPHFFRGVATVVTKLLNIIQPDRAYFGQKDAQQCVVLRAMIRDLLLPIKMRAIPTERHEDGLAMSSRNRYLNPEMRSVATVLYKALQAAQSMVVDQHKMEREEILGPAFKIVQAAVEDVKAKGYDFEIRLDYLSMVDVATLSEVQMLGKNQPAILSGAVYVGTTRLIDNVLLNTKEL